MSAGLFAMLGIAPALGRDFVAADDTPGAPAVVILSDDLWQRRYHADPAVIGRALTLNGRPSTVVGVLPPRVKFPFNQVAWVPLAPVAHAARRADRDLQVFGLLRPGVGRQQAHDEINAVARRLADTYADNDGWSAVGTPPRRVLRAERGTGS